MNRNELIVKLLEKYLEKAKKGNLHFESMDERVLGSVFIGVSQTEPLYLEITLRFYEEQDNES